MPIFEPIKDAIVYTWHNNSTLRLCCKIVTCPLCGLCYWLRHIGPIHIFHKRPGTSGPPRREHTLANIKYRRRVRGLRRRKRSVSVDRTWGPWRKNAEDQSQSPFFAKLPAELRLKIYEMVLCEQEEVGLTCDHLKYSDCWEVKAASDCNIEMLRTCKKMFVSSSPFGSLSSRRLTIDTGTARPFRSSTLRTRSNSKVTDHCRFLRRPSFRNASLRSAISLSTIHTFRLGPAILVIPGTTKTFLRPWEVSQILERWY